MRITVDLHGSASLKRLGCVAALALTTTVSADVVHTFEAGSLLTADELNENFADVDARIVAIEDALAAGVPLAQEAEAAAPGNFDVPGTLRLGVTIAAGGSCSYESAAGYTDCTCPAGMLAFSGGAYTSTGYIDENRNVGDINGTLTGGWRMACKNGAGVRIQCQGARAYCARIASLP